MEGWIKPSLFDDIPNGDMLVSFFVPSRCFLVSLLKLWIAFGFFVIGSSYLVAAAIEM